MDDTQTPASEQSLPAQPVRQPESGQSAQADFVVNPSGAVLTARAPTPAPPAAALPVAA